jgi:hypothetical protein
MLPIPKSRPTSREPSFTEFKVLNTLLSEVADLKRLVAGALKGKAVAQRPASGTKSYAQAATAPIPAQPTVNFS